MTVRLVGAMGGTGAEKRPNEGTAWRARPGDGDKGAGLAGPQHACAGGEGDSVRCQLVGLFSSSLHLSVTALVFGTSISRKSPLLVEISVLWRESPDRQHQQHLGNREMQTIGSD